MKCIDCKFHKIIPDPDPNDWLCRDDVAIVCTQMANDDIDMKSEYASDRQEYKVVSCSLRPYQVIDIIRPTWCTLECIIRDETINNILNEI